ncbi:hypothetical protein [Microbulbifer sp. JMSA003]
MAGKVPVGSPERASHNQAGQARSAPSGLDSLRVASVALASNVMAKGGIV